MKDFLDCDLSKVALVRGRKYRHGVWYDGVEFWDSLRKEEFAFIDVLTFSVGECPTSIPIRRLIIGAPGKRWKPKSLPRTIMGVAVYQDIHAKLVLGFDNNLVTAYVGSLNLCSSQSGELMVEVQSPPQVDELLAYYNQLWDERKL